LKTQVEYFSSQLVYFLLLSFELQVYQFKPVGQISLALVIFQQFLVSRLFYHYDGDGDDGGAFSCSSFQPIPLDLLP
jgi:hypothetical protein